MQTFPVLASYNIGTRAPTLLFPRGAEIFFVQQEGSVSVQGCLAAKFYTLVKEGHGVWLPAGTWSSRSVPGMQGTDRAPVRLPSPVTPGGHLTPGITTEGGGQIKQIMMMRF